MKKRWILFFLAAAVLAACRPSTPVPAPQQVPVRVVTVQPSLTPGPTRTVAPTLTPSLSPTPLPRFELSEAVHKGLVRVASARGRDLARLELELDVEAGFNFELEIRPGSMFVPADSSVQKMVVRQAEIVELKAG